MGKFFFDGMDIETTKFIISTMEKSADSSIRDTGLITRLLLLSPLTDRNGELWPPYDKNDVNPEHFPLWLLLTQKRYEFEHGNHYVATEIKNLCDKLNLWAPLEILDWMSSNPERVISKSEKRDRKKELDKRNWRAEYTKLISVFKITPTAALGWIQQRLESAGILNERGLPFTDDTIRSYIEHEAGRVEAESYFLKVSKKCELTEDECNEWQRKLIDRYPEEVKEDYERIKKGFVKHCIK